MSLMTSTAPARSRTTVVPGVLTPEQVATELQTSPRTVRRWIQRGELEAIVLPSGRVRVPIHALRRLPRAHAQEAQPCQS